MFFLHHWGQPHPQVMTGGVDPSKMGQQFRFVCVCVLPRWMLKEFLKETVIQGVEVEFDWPTFASPFRSRGKKG